jgi:hypothetical protein
MERKQDPLQGSLLNVQYSCSILLGFFVIKRS